MEQKVLVPSTTIVGYIDPEKLNLDKLPELKVSNQVRSGKNPVCLGFVTFHKSIEGYGFVVTYGANLIPSDQSRPVQEIYFKKADTPISTLIIN